MPKKQKAQKMSLGGFLADETLGSWADDMENLPTARKCLMFIVFSTRAYMGHHSQRQQGRQTMPRPTGSGVEAVGLEGIVTTLLVEPTRFASRFSDRGPSGPPREDLPLPTAPPYTVFVGNLAFDLVEDDLAGFFAPESLKSIKVIRDREDNKPKGFGYVEFETLAGLKNGLTKSGTQLNSRTVRVSVAEPPKEREQRSGFSSFGDEASNWRREGPPPSMGGGRSRFEDRPPREPVDSVADTVSDWRANRPARQTPPSEEPSRRSGSGFRDAAPRAEMTWERKGTLVEHVQADRPSAFRRGSGFNTPSGDRESAPLGAAETDEVWARGPPRAAAQAEEPPRRGMFGGRGGEGPQLNTGGPPDMGDWRSQMKSPVLRQGSLDKSPTSSQPTTPQGNRKRLELLPRSTTGSNVPSPLSSPRMNATPSVAKANPFGAARPIDVSAKDREIAEKIEKEREARARDKSANANPFGNARPNPMSRQGSTSGVTRTQSTPRSDSPGEGENKGEEGGGGRAANKFDSKAAQVRAQTSFAAAAGMGGKKEDASVKDVTDKIAEVTV
ncbi:hypothetical protein FRC10_008741 [Ceratobasidium sp. 414]|nr:hypothetical protein FRC10_008741 [Ceratobasidium sp. 414]